MVPYGICGVADGLPESLRWAAPGSAALASVLLTLAASIRRTSAEPGQPRGRTIKAYTYQQPA